MDGVQMVFLSLYPISSCLIHNEGIKGRNDPIPSKGDMKLTEYQINEVSQCKWPSGRDLAGTSYLTPENAFRHVAV